ncbi:MAG: carbohydrate kinase family protein [Chloroflexia bacterium]
MADVLTIGELRVDLVAGRAGPLAGAQTFTRAPGGDMASVAAGVVRLGRSAAFVGLVGDDPFGRYLLRALDEHGVDTRYIGIHPRGRTPVAFVNRPDDAGTPGGDGSLLSPMAEEPGEKTFLFYREGGADQLLSPAWVPTEAVEQARVVVGSGVSLASALPRATLHAAIDTAHAAGVAVALDVDWRPALWQTPERARDLYYALFPQVDILMLSASEMIMLTGGTASSEEGRLGAILHAWVERLVAGRTKPLLVALTRGPDGCTYGLWHPGGPGMDITHLAACDILAKDRSGAGEAFMAGLLVALLDRGMDLSSLTLDDMAAVFAWANASGALATTRRGAMAALPGRSSVLRLVKGGRAP